MARQTIIQNYMGKKMGDFLSGVIGDINPVSLAAGEGRGKNDVMGNLKAVKDLAISKKGMSLSDFFAGKKIQARITGDKTNFKKMVDTKNDEARASARAIAAGTVAAYGLSPMVLGEDNVVNRTIAGGAGLAMHAGITAASIRSGGAGAMFGVGYAGFAAMNAIRQGDNFGPF